MEKFLLAHGCATRISDTQKGDKVIVLLHGYFESLDIWEDLTILLRDNYRVISLDIPGHGISEVKGEVHTMEFLADVVAGVMNELGASSGTIVGHSMGGYVALAFAERHPDMLDSLILLHSAPNSDTELKKSHREREIELIISGKKDLLAKLTPSLGFAEKNRVRFKNQINNLSDQIIMTEPEGALAILRGMAARSDKNDVMLKLNKPELFIFGKLDDYIPEEIALEIAQKQPQAEVVWLENSGHMGLIEEKELVAETIHAFIQAQ